jgi:hypothetical protein
MSPSRVAVGCLLAFAPGARAELLDRGAYLVYDTDLQVTWLANHHAAFGSPYDVADGQMDGKLTWLNAQDWAADLAYYDSVRDVTWDDWSIPFVNLPCIEHTTPVGDKNWECPGSPLEELYFALGGNGGPITHTHNSSYDFFFGGLDEFTYYQTSTLNPANPGGSNYIFSFYNGRFGFGSRNSSFRVLAMRPGDVGLPGAACENALDDDGDGLADLDDPGCLADPEKGDETDASLPCDNGLDDDGDGSADLDDPGCPFPYAEPEDPACDDGLDNDGDGLVDFDDPTCDPGWPYWEVLPSPPVCGLGAEIAALLPLLAWLRARRRRA